MLAINTCKSRRQQKGLGVVPVFMWGTALAILESNRSLSLTVHVAIKLEGGPDSSEALQSKTDPRWRR